MPGAQPRTSWPAVVGWACYLACSWTWCIGMFLPVLLIRDYGVWGFVVFAVPNVLGAAAMGWVLRSPEQSRALVGKHLAACGAFTVVTVSFHGFFLFWLVGLESGGELRPASVEPGWAGAVVFIAFVLGTIAACNPQRPRPLGAAAAWCGSAAAALALQRAGVLRWSAPAVPGEAAAAVLWLTPVCAFGFGLCPYLDLTFHHARQRTGPAAALAFTLGFAAFFLFMILFTFGYSARILGAARIDGWTWLHIAGQTAFTLMAHAGLALTLFRFTRGRRGRSVLAAAGVAAAAVGIGPILAGMDGVAPGRGGLSFGEVVYRGYMAFYGLVFPAYVWLCMIPTGDGHSGLGGPRGRVKRNIWLGSVGVAAPMFWMGFIERQEVWLAPGLAVVLAARLLLPRRHTGV